MKFSAEFSIASYDVDINGLGTPSCVMRYIQQTADLQHETYGPTLGALRQRGCAFVLCRLALDMGEPLFEHQRIRVTTWMNRPKGFGIPRFAVITREDIPVARAEMLWGLLDLSSRAPLRAENAKPGFSPEEESFSCPPGIRFRVPEELLQRVGTHRTVYSDCDENGHLNNTVYPAVFCDHVPMQGMRTASLALNFRREALYGSTFDILSCEKEGNTFFTTRFPDGTSGTEAVFRFARIRENADLSGRDADGGAI